MPGGRVMANLGGGERGTPGSQDADEALAAMVKVFGGGNVYRKKLDGESRRNNDVKNMQSRW
eukprot:794056-Pyramimonas_sp.AAC.1